MTKVKYCPACGKEVSNHRKYCNAGCNLVYIHQKVGKTIYPKLCKCGCGNYIVSRYKNTNKEYISNHDKVLDVKITCQLCLEESDKLYSYTLPTFNLKVCIGCFRKVFEMNIIGG